eukprot:10761052-Ditylum_brightwellii.AAC.1
MHQWHRGQCCLLQCCMHCRPPASLVSFPGFGARTVAPASDKGAAFPWWQWQQDDFVLLIDGKEDGGGSNDSRGGSKW